ncbi:hypothetical protein FA15DRAFT_675652 [Coprinopsis marcescibilis]|uniref:Uncharacterized protein n=1 Tax=Coprinopsis marcescibilis TaxID=230819 RepID=A0A5C3KD17_COPMA|nr:hypothetical protein FA15DRAFT_675652 [Coprinopsis marcescibilis]
MPRNPTGRMNLLCSTISYALAKTSSRSSSWNDRGRLAPPPKNGVLPPQLMPLQIIPNLRLSSSSSASSERGRGRELGVRLPFPPLPPPLPEPGKSGFRLLLQLMPLQMGPSLKRRLSSSGSASSERGRGCDATELVGSIKTGVLSRVRRPEDDSLREREEGNERT